MPGSSLGWWKGYSLSGSYITEIGCRIVIPTAPSPGNAFTYFWGVSLSFTDAGATDHGGAHFGLQWNQNHPSYKAINWGGYNAAGAVLSGTTSAFPSANGDPNTRDYNWSTNTPYWFKAYKSAGGWSASVSTDKVNWTVIRELAAGGDRIADGSVSGFLEQFYTPDGADPQVDGQWSHLYFKLANDTTVYPNQAQAGYNSGIAPLSDTDVYRLWPDAGFHITTRKARTAAAGDYVTIDVEDNPLRWSSSVTWANTNYYWNGVSTAAPPAPVNHVLKASNTGRGGLSTWLTLVYPLFGSLSGAGSATGRLGYMRTIAGRGASVGASTFKLGQEGLLRASLPGGGSGTLALTVAGQTPVPLPNYDSEATLTTTFRPKLVFTTSHGSLFEVGDIVTLTIEVLDGSEYTDPANIYCQIKSPSGAISTSYYGVDDTASRISKGVYRFEMPVYEAGEHQWKITTNKPSGIDQGDFLVEASNF